MDAQDGERVRLRVRFSAESLPPDTRTGGYDIPLDVGRADLAAAARTWAAECDEFPPRG